MTISSSYTCIEFQDQLSDNDLSSMIAVLAPIVLHKHQASMTEFSSIEEIALELDDDVITEEDALDKIQEVIWLYLDCIETTVNKTSLVVRSEDDSDYDDFELFREIAKHLFAKTQNTHFLLRSAAFDKGGAYSHQWIGYVKDGEVVLVHTDDYFEQMFERQPALMVI